MKQNIILLFVLAFLLPAVSAAEISSCPAQECPAGNDYCIFYFYGEGCTHCAQASPFISQLTEKYSNFTLHKLEIYFNSTNQEIFQDFVSRYKIERAGVPAIFIGSDALIGTDQIKNNLETKINYYNVR